MRPLTAISSLLSGWLGCSAIDPTEHDENESSTASSPAVDAGAIDIRRSSTPAAPRDTLMELARDAFISTTPSAPPPPVGSTAPLLRLSRPKRSAVELVQRVNNVLTIMELSVEASETLTWARAATNTSDVLKPSIFEPAPGVVVTYDSMLDDLMVIDTRAIDRRTRVRTDAVPWEDARRVLRALVDGDVVDPRLSLDEAAVAFVRSGAGGPGGEDEQWVDEIRFEANLRVEGTPLVDAGIRIGITPTREVSSIRVTGMVIEPVGTITIGTTARALQDAFSEHVVGTAPAFDSLQISMRRPVYLLDPSATSGLVEPTYLIAHSMVLRHGAVSSASRSTITLWSMTSPVPTLVARLPD